MTSQRRGSDYLRAPPSPKTIDRTTPSHLIPPALGEEETDYFTSNPPPSNLEQISKISKEFIDFHVSHSRRVVLVTSGGTTVPLENQTVRFIDNFSAGTRGACSAEYFLEAGYAVIFLHREFSLLPYSRHYSHSTNCFLDFLSEAPPLGGSTRPSVVAKDEFSPVMLTVLRKYLYAKRENLLLLLPFTTITSYLFLLREIALNMKPLGSKSLFYLAAAVSDFFVPRDRMVEHKIQSGDIPSAASENDDSEAVDTGSSSKPTFGKKLIIDLDPVPKFLKRLVEAWAPESMIVSFKLETDASLLLSKCQLALKRYSHNLVIGNLLSTRKYEVLFVDKERAEWLRLPQLPQQVGDHNKASNTSSAGSDSGDLYSKRHLDEIEAVIVPEVVRRHGALIWAAVAASSSGKEG